ncbi:MAG: PTS sugar transporter subunit IIA [Pirellulales bacterium]|nr:PTS sugar transporter subunit IIA [Pirellulales bacterium]
MSGTEFDLSRLADYLHLSPDKLLRLAERGQIPARRLRGEWRFSEQEIHQWLEQRIGGSNPEDLADMETVLRGPQSQTAGAQLTLSELLLPAAIELNLDARTRPAVFPAIVAVAARTGLVWDNDKLAAALKAREELQSTALEQGVALLHARRPQTHILGDAFVALGRLPSGIPFGNSRNIPTDLFFLICMLEDKSHLQILARISRLIVAPNVLEGLRAADSPQNVLAIIRDAETTFLADAS